MSDFDKIVKKLGPDSINDWAGKVWSSSLSDIELPTEINPDNVAKTRKFLSLFIFLTTKSHPYYNPKVLFNLFKLAYFLLVLFLKLS